ncbi:MAG: acyl carrier protein [Anaerolineales bacterium]
MVQYQNGLVDRIQTVLAAALNVDASEITAETQFGDLPQWDSMGHMEVLVALEKEFGVEVTADTITNLISVPAICQYIEGNSHV